MAVEPLLDGMVGNQAVPLELFGERAHQRQQQHLTPVTCPGDMPRSSNMNLLKSSSVVP